MADLGVPLFGAATLDRAAALRDNADAIAAHRADPAARAIALWRGKPWFQGTDAPRLAWRPLDAPVFAEADEPPLFLGLETGAPRFAFDVSPWIDPTGDQSGAGGFIDTSRPRHPSFAGDEAFLDLRAEMARLAPTDAGHAAMAKGLLGWHATHRFCARCGQPSEIDQAGWRRRCPACGGMHFPRTDPVVIMLITDGNQTLLGRSPGWPEGMYSLLAGFLEPGETIEDAVRREVFEETAIRVGPVRYLASQPWPFPASLMIGCWGRAETTDITLDPVELDAARWVSRETVRDAMQGLCPDLKPARQGAIARFILDAWLAGKLDV